MTPEELRVHRELEFLRVAARTGWKRGRDAKKARKDLAKRMEKLQQAKRAAS